MKGCETCKDCVPTHTVPCGDFVAVWVRCLDDGKKRKEKADCRRHTAAE